MDTPSFVGSCNLPFELLRKILNYTQAILLQQHKFNEARKLCYVSKKIFEDQFRCYYDVDHCEKLLGLEHVDHSDFCEKMLWLDLNYLTMRDMAEYMAAQVLKRTEMELVPVATMMIYSSGTEKIFSCGVKLWSSPTYRYLDKKMSTGATVGETYYISGKTDYGGMIDLQEFVTPLFIFEVYENINLRNEVVTDPVLDNKSWTALEFRCKQAFGVDFAFAYLKFSRQEGIGEQVYLHYL